MRTAALTLLSFVAFGYAAKTQQFSLLPQVGFENSKTKISYNNSSAFAPAGITFSPQVGVQLSYKTKQGHGFFLGASTSRNTVPFSFANPETGFENYNAITGNMQVRMEGGYQFKSKPIYFKKQSSTITQSSNTTTQKKACGSYSYRSSCMKNKTEANRLPDPNTVSQPASNKGTWVKLQPSVGMGFIPFTKTDVVTKMQNAQTTYEYRAGNWNTALVAGMGFEFGRNNTRLFTVSVNYLKGLGNLDRHTVSTVVGTKTLTTQLQSEVTGWNMRIGVPFTLGGKKPVVKQQQQSIKKIEQPRSKCGQYKIVYRCNKTI